MEEGRKNNELKLADRRKICEGTWSHEGLSYLVDELQLLCF
jgi:hypothetical protein